MTSPTGRLAAAARRAAEMLLDLEILAEDVPGELGEDARGFAERTRRELFTLADRAVRP